MKYQFPDMCRNLRLTSVQCVCLLYVHILSGNEPTNFFVERSRRWWRSKIDVVQKYVWRAACFSIIGLQNVMLCDGDDDKESEANWLDYGNLNWVYGEQFILGRIENF